MASKPKRTAPDRSSPSSEPGAPPPDGEKPVFDQTTPEPEREAPVSVPTTPKSGGTSRWLQGARIAPAPVTGNETVRELIDSTFLAYNAARLREAAQLLSGRILREGVTVGVSLSGALTPAGLGGSCLIPLIENGFVDWISTTGANLYHDAHFALDLDLHRGSPHTPDPELRRDGVIRIYDVLFTYEVLLETDRFFRTMAAAEEFGRSMSSAEFHHLVGKYLTARAEALGTGSRSILVSAYEHGVPVYTPSPGDSSIWMNMARLALEGGGPAVDVSADVNETAAIVYGAKAKGERSAVLVLGGGAPKNFVLQTEPQIQEVLGLEEAGHDYFVQITDARPDTGGLSGATPSEAMTWGKIDPDALSDTVVCYTDTTIALPLLTSYLLAACDPRPPARLYDRRSELLTGLKAAFRARQTEEEREDS